MTFKCFPLEKKGMPLQIKKMVKLGNMMTDSVAFTFVRNEWEITLQVPEVKVLISHIDLLIYFGHRECPLNF